MSRRPKSTAPGDAGEIHQYQFSGIEERHGVVPAWLVVVIASLLVWMVYYLVRNWTPPQ